MKNLVPWRFLFGFVLVICSTAPIGFGDERTSQVQLETKFVEVQDQNNRELGVHFRELENANLNESHSLTSIDRIKDPMNNLRSMDSAASSGFGDNIGLDIVPKIDPKNFNRIQMAVEPKVNTLEGKEASAEVKDKLPVVLPSPSTQQTVILDPLISQDVKPENDKAPFLSSIPILGRLFRSKLESSKQKELTVFITPHIVDPSGED